MAEDVPADVRAVLGQLFTEGQTASTDGDTDTVADVVDTVRRVATNKLPEGDLRARLLHGCDRLQVELDADTPDTEVLAAYLQAMERQLDETE